MVGDVIKRLYLMPTELNGLTSGCVKRPWKSPLFGAKSSTRGTPNFFCSEYVNLAIIPLLAFTNPSGNKTSFTVSGCSIFPLESLVTISPSVPLLVLGRRPGNPSSHSNNWSRVFQQQPNVSVPHPGGPMTDTCNSPIHLRRYRINNKSYTRMGFRCMESVGCHN